MVIGEQSKNEAMQKAPNFTILSHIPRSNES